jgi:Family of unknown function (DUF5684)
VGLSLALAIVFIVATWMIFSKAGRPGWASIIPIYNTLTLLWIVGRPWWWILLLLVPILNVIIWIVVANDLSNAFGHGLGFTLGLIFLSPIFVLILAFGSSEYRGTGGLAVHA